MVYEYSSSWSTRTYETTPDALVLRSKGAGWSIRWNEITDSAYLLPVKRQREPFATISRFFSGLFFDVFSVPDGTGQVLFVRDPSKHRGIERVLIDESNPQGKLFLQEVRTLSRSAWRGEAESLGEAHRLLGVHRSEYQIQRAPKYSLLLLAVFILGIYLSSSVPEAIVIAYVAGAGFVAMFLKLLVDIVRNKPQA